MQPIMRIGRNAFGGVVTYASSGITVCAKTSVIRGLNLGLTSVCLTSSCSGLALVISMGCGSGVDKIKVVKNEAAIHVFYAERHISDSAVSGRMYGRDLSGRMKARRRISCHARVAMITISTSYL